MNDQTPTSEPKPVKPCNGCGQILMIDAFFKNKRMKDGLQTQCRSCMRALQDKWRTNNSDKVKRTAKKSYLKNQDYNKARARKRYLDNPDYFTQWAKDNKDSCKASSQKYYAKNKEKLRQKSRDWDAKNPDKFKERMQRSAHARRARLAGAGGKLSKGIVPKLLKLQKGKCTYCATVLHKHHLDHIIPLVLGGKNTDDNVQLLCPPCNMSKGARHPIDYMQSKGFLL